MRFCAKTRGLNEEQNKEFAKDLKEFTNKEVKKFQNSKPKEEPEE